MITVIGLGYVGLTTALGFSKKGIKTYGIDTNKERVNSLKNYQVPFFEPHLEDVLKEELNHHFFINSSLQEAITNSEAVFVCVGTPESEDGSAYLGYLLKAIEEIFSCANEQLKVIVIKSSVPPSTISKKIKPFVDELNLRYQKAINLACNPEFLREGYAWEDFMNPDRIVIGVEHEISKKVMQRLYLPFGAPVHFVSFNSAEFIKYLSNTLLSTLISYSNEMAMIAEEIGGIDIPTAFKILHQDKRWTGQPAPMTSYVFPGCGYGGYCLPKDTAALNRIAKEHGVEAGMLEANLHINEQIKKHIAKKIAAEIPKGSVIGILGLSFKSGSDDVRLSPSKAIIDHLLQEGYQKIIAYDPLANAVFEKEYGLPIVYANSLQEIAEKADAFVLLTSWPEFKKQKELLLKKKLFDCRYALVS